MYDFDCKFDSKIITFKEALQFQHVIKLYYITQNID
jgi:hypothetical protein